MAIANRATGKGIITSGNDGILKFWNDKFFCERQIDTTDFDLQSIKIAAVSENSKGMIAFGTRGSEIMRLNNKGENRELLIQGHYDGQLQGLVVHPKQFNLFYTAGDDGLVCKWDIGKHRMLKKKSFGFPLNVIDINGEGNAIAVGTVYGEIGILNTDNLEPLREFLEVEEGKEEEILMIKFSPKGDLLAASYNQINEVLSYFQFVGRGEEEAIIY